MDQLQLALEEPGTNRRRERGRVLIDVEHRGCPCCGGVMHAIGELRSEQLDIVPAQLRVLRGVTPQSVEIEVWTA